MRFTLSKLFLAVALIGLACAGMTYRTVFWSDGIISLTVFLYAAIALRAIGQHGQERTFAIAFSVVGCSYLIVATSACLPVIRSALVTNWPLALIANPPSTSAESLVTSAFPPGATTTPLARFFLIGHCVWSWFFALLAGWAAATMYAKRQRDLPPSR